MSSSRGNTSHDGYYFPAPRGLVVTAPTGRDRLVMSDQELCDDIVATLPKLSAAVARDTYGRRWKQGHRKHGVDCFELSTVSDADASSSMDDEGAGDDLDIAHAVVAKAELRCHLNEVLNVLITHESGAYESTMQALVGRKFKKGDVLFSQKRRLSREDRRQSLVIAPRRPSGSDSAEDEAPEQALLTVATATLRPTLTVKLSARHKRTQKLCLSTFTQQYAAEHRAVHVIKTLPKPVHDELVSASDRTALRRELDHLAVGFHIQTTRRKPGAGSNAQITRVFAHGYASPTPPSQFGLLGRKQAGVANSVDLARRREGIMNPEAKHVLRVLTKSLRNLELVVRRRRFGFQSFIYFPVGYDEPNIERACAICSKKFNFFRRDFFCHLCGHMCCRDCSQLYEVEARVGEIRKNRCCLQCVHRVDSCVFDDEDLLEALDGPAVVDVDDERWLNDDQYHLALLESSGDLSANDTASFSSSEELAEQLSSTDDAQRSHALEALGQLVRPVAAKVPYTFADPSIAAKANMPILSKKKPKNKVQQVQQDVENYLSASLRATRDEFRARDRYQVAGLERDYVLEFDESKTTKADLPLPPMPPKRKEAKRLEFIENSGVLRAEFDNSALNLIAEVAAKRLNCPIGFVSVVDGEQFHAIGGYNLPPDALHMDRTNNVCIHQVYGEKPLILKNPQRDMRFAQMPCVRELDVKFYAGFPIHGPEGDVVASLCAADLAPHNNISTKDYATMEALAKLAADLITPPSPSKSLGGEDVLGMSMVTNTGRGKQYDHAAPGYVY